MQNIPGNTAKKSAAVPVPSCLICDRWVKTPFALRPTTPTTVQDTETALVLGYWIATRKPEDIAARLCSRHVDVLCQLDTIDRAVREFEAAQRVPVENERQAEFRTRAEAIATRLSQPPATVAAPPMPLDVASLGLVLPGPPQAPAIDTPDEPGIELTAYHGAGSIASALMKASVTDKAAEAVPLADDNEPPEGWGPSFPCPLCQKIVKGGEVHYC